MPHPANRRHGASSRRIARAGLLAAVLFAGICSSAAALEPRILGGNDVQITDHPYQVQVNRDEGFTCGGAIRDASHVVTAAHCVVEEEAFFPFIVAPNTVSVGYGDDDEANLKFTSVSRISVFPAYLRDPASPDFDVAVLTLETPLVTNATTAPIDFASLAELDTAYANDVPGFVTGWGLTSESGSTGSPSLKGVSLTLREDAPCIAEYGAISQGGGYDSDTMICAGGDGSAPSGNPDTCQGDSGGPLVIDTNSDSMVEVYKLIGIVNYGNGCGRAGVPGVYAWVQSDILFPFLDAATPPAPPVAPAATPTVTGTPRVGQTLTCNAPPLPGAQVTSYIWSVYDPASDSFTAIALSPRAVLILTAATQGARLVCDARYENGGGFAYSDAPAASAVGPVAPAPTTTTPAKDTTPPRARIRKVSCKRGKCTIEVSASDVGGRVRSLTAKLTYKVRRCRTVGGRKRCKSVKKTKKLRPRKTSGGFTIATRLKAGRYTVSAVAVDTSGNRSRAARKTFRVKRR